MAVQVDSDLLEAALVGYREKLKQIEARMAELRNRMNGGTVASAPPRPAAQGKRAASPKRKRTLSPEGRARIIAALRKRWAAVKKSEGPRPGAKASRKATRPT